MSEAREAVRVDVDGEVMVVTIDRPEARNALRVQDKVRLTEILTAAGRGEARCVVLTGAGDKAFCAGSDLKEMAGMDATTCLQMEEVEATLHDVTMRLPIPVVAAVNGWALGTGCELVVTSDIVLADPSARFGQPEILNGAPTPIQAALLPRIIGLGRARWLVYTGQTIDARTAAEWGMVSVVTEPGASLARAVETARELVKVHPVSMALQKRIVDSWIRDSFDSSVWSSKYVTASAYNSGWPQSAVERMHLRRDDAETR
ncbi:MAG TPA: enoyl-CoA hydratase/isomerase family protein [Mycobacteriales bacterium]